MRERRIGKLFRPVYGTLWEAPLADLGHLPEVDAATVPSTGRIALVNNKPYHQGEWKGGIEGDVCLRDVGSVLLIAVMLLACFFAC